MKELKSPWGSNPSVTENFYKSKTQEVIDHIKEEQQAKDVKIEKIKKKVIRESVKIDNKKIEEKETTPQNPYSKILKKLS